VDHDEPLGSNEQGPIVILGREPELATLAAFVTGGFASRSLVLEGEAGAGKTTLWQAAVEEADRHGWLVLACRPAASESKLSFAALGDLLGEVLARVESEIPAPQRRALEVALLLEEPGDEAAEQRTLGAATLSALRALARADPVLVAIDDVQWLDDPSSAALAFAARRLGDSAVAFLAARRPEDGRVSQGLEDALEQRHEHRLGRLRVGPLPPGAMPALIQSELGAALPRGVLARIDATSRGNPYYALELARAMLRRNAPLEPGIALPVPETLKALVRERLDVLPAPAQDLVAVAAALSEPTLARLAAAGAAEDAVDIAVRAGVLDVDADGRVGFVHPLLASGAYHRLGPAARRALHLRLATVAEGEERARHLALGSSAPSSAVAYELHGAARLAASRGAIAAAAELSEHSIRLTPRTEPERLAERRLDAAGYEVRTGDTARARANLDPLLRDLPAGPLRARVVLRLARLEEGGPLRGLELCRRVIHEAGEEDHVLSAEANQLAAEMSMLAGDVPGALEHARIASALAEKGDDASILVECLGTFCHFETYTGTITPGMLEHAVEVERRQPRPSNNYSPREIMGLRLMYADRLDEARELLEASCAASAELGDELDRASLLIHLTQLECRAGRLAQAERHAREAEVAIEQAGAPRPAGRFATALAAAHVGRVEEARSAAQDGAAVAAAGGSRVFHALNEWVLGFLDLSIGDAVAADRHLRSLPRELDAMGYRNPGVRPVYADAIEARIAAGDHDVEPDIDELEWRGVALDNAWARAVAARCRGLLLAARGELDGAIVELRRALGEHERSPQPLERGRTLLAIGTTERRARRRASAREALTEALELFDNLGAALWAERASSELARIPGRARSSSDDLTETEARVAGLVADGLSNKEVAARLFVTVRTVEWNLSSIYAKLGVRSRSELAARFVRGSGA